MTEVMRAMEAKPSVGRAERLLALGWSGAENVARQLLSLAFFFASVHFLQPSDLGMFALSVAFCAIPQVFIDEPAGEALVQHAEDTAIIWDTGFTLNLALTCGLLAALTLASVPLSWLFGEPALMLTLPALGFGSLLGALGNIQKAHLARRLRFRAIAQTTLMAQLVAGSLGLAMAMWGFGYWALIANVVTAAGLSSAIYAIRSSWKPSLRIDRACLSNRLSYAGYSAALRAMYLLRDQLPLLIAGSLLDLAHVGLLSLAMRVARSLSQLFEEVTSRPMLSLLSRERGDEAQFGSVLTEIITWVNLAAMPAYACVAMLGPLAIAVLFGPAWAPAGAMLPYLCVVLAGWLSLHMVAVALRSRARGRTALRLAAPAVLLDGIILAAAMPFGLTYALAAWAARSALWLPAVIRLLRTELDVIPGELARRGWPSLAGSALAVAAIAALQARGRAGQGWMELATEIAVAALAYLAVIAVSAVALNGRRGAKDQLMSVIGRVG